MKTTVVIESLSTTSTRCSVPEITSLLQDTMIFKPEEMIGIIDFRSLGYYKIKQGILQQKLSRYYRFEKAENSANTLINL